MLRPHDQVSSRVVLPGVDPLTTNMPPPHLTLDKDTLLSHFYHGLRTKADAVPIQDASHHHYVRMLCTRRPFVRPFSPRGADRGDGKQGGYVGEETAAVMAACTIAMLLS
jgi:hypothetical protein